ncbi:cation diffusion facilitator family transporter [Microbacterium sp. MPKO10]|uniref:cation diffusion facilitator family transporter n=1 Tax=Microbacterium sp. MPKO10 TaxID=2989818 RepID=UPI002235C9D3|nr:cation diffusion facilitator family transporter [Microbacterium sp. MPKO10]MCW4458137.1 cation diffusion facilitator family transporter [Microbacterium sp. MPKO10]
MAHDHSHGTTNRKRLIVVIVLVSATLVAEVVGGIFTGSLALLADAGHMFSDLTGLIIALIAIGIAARPATDRHTWGFQRTEVLAALLNGLILTVVAVTVALEGIQRLIEPDPGQVDGLPVLLVALVGLVVNAISLALLRDGAQRSINMKGAYLEVFGDLLGSVLVAGAAIVIMTTGFVEADAIASLLIAAGILPRAGILLRDVWRVLNESTPVGTDVELIRDHVRAAPGVIDVHDVHVWSITSGASVFSAHVIVTQEVFAQGRVAGLLDELGSCLAEHFDVEHSTFQLEPATRTVSEDTTHA